MPASWEEQRLLLSARTSQKATGARVCEMPCMQVSGPTPPSMAFRGPGRPRSIFYFSVSAFAAPGFGLADAFGTLEVDARIFFLSALGFLASRLLLF